MSTKSSTQKDRAGTTDPISHLENIGSALLDTSETLRNYARSIVTNMKQAESILDAEER